jgi:hypothetical protein
MTNSESVFGLASMQTLPTNPETLISENDACEMLGVSPEILQAFSSLYGIGSTGKIKGMGTFYRFPAIEEILSGNHMENFIYQVTRN